MPTHTLMHCPHHRRSWMKGDDVEVECCPWCDVDRLGRANEQIGLSLSEIINHQHDEIERLRSLCDKQQTELEQWIAVSGYNYPTGAFADCMRKIRSDRDEAREAARKCWEGGVSYTEMLDKYPWLEEE